MWTDVPGQIAHRHGSGAEIFNDAMSADEPGQVSRPPGNNAVALEDRSAAKGPGFANRASVTDVEIGERSNGTIKRERYPAPTQGEAGKLGKVTDSIPTVAWLLRIVEGRGACLASDLHCLNLEPCQRCRRLL